MTGVCIELLYKPVKGNGEHRNSSLVIKAKGLELGRYELKFKCLPVLPFLGWNIHGWAQNLFLTQCSGITLGRKAQGTM